MSKVTSERLPEYRPDQATITGSPQAPETPTAPRPARELHYKATNTIAPTTAEDPYLRPSFTIKNRILRLIWNAVWLLLYRLSPRPLHGWRSFLLRLFGARMGPDCHFYPGSKIWAPWNLICADQVTAADGAEIYNPAPIEFGSHAIVSQGAYICSATHDFDDPAFPLLAYSMRIGAYAWICARACVGPGVSVGEGAVLGLASVASRNLEPWTVYAGSPAVRVKERKYVAPQ
jgi:putative colanic acid biosynthesis acetyltransferase WcaF